MELNVYDESLTPGETMKLALWNYDTELTKNLDLKGCYYKISIQHATTNIYIHQTSINTTKGGIIEITKGEPGTHESGVITNWKRKKEKNSDDSRKRKHNESSANNESGKSTRNQ
ncbi:hypothetical protein DAPPUDRAFT_271149 [Daphnia pulex]|uniref:Uncharacterized protein n=1 Tax=Daphnia pulex TaxID=6669 RepID=E9I1T5_DAPPU|nr:hypothetical protein DAPPUDRAFT_271149 [Daphnia pulex]|eukprot:EFX62046.1 hypothetical protein DAPPUDRAFT_271149 [Daphnia pulex]